MAVQDGAYYVFRSTTDKLAEHLNHITESGDTIVTPAFTGGRDWVIVCRKGRALSDVERAVRAGVERGRRIGA